MAPPIAVHEPARAPGAVPGGIAHPEEVLEDVRRSRYRRMTAGSGNSRRVEQAQARFARVTFAECLGVTISEVAPDRAVLVLPYRPEHMNSTVHVTTAVSGQLVAMGQVSYRLLEPWPERSRP